MLGPLTDDLLTPDVRVWQRADGHRFSSDDVATAYVAHRARPEARTLVDLGTGLGSVLLLLTWRMPWLTATGIEAQEKSFELLSRNVARARLGERVNVVHGDLRDRELLRQAPAGVDLVTGTPPYFPVGSALDAQDEQRSRARVEHRGGVEVYVRAGAELLGPRGALVLCGDSEAAPRLERAAQSSGLRISEVCAVLPRFGRPPLFTVWTLERHERATAVRRFELVLRDVDGTPAGGARELKRFSGF